MPKSDRASFVQRLAGRNSSEHGPPDAGPIWADIISVAATTRKTDAIDECLGALAFST
jgi:hypothetical protein